MPPQQEGGHIKADAAGADHGNPAADRLFAADHLVIPVDMGQISPGDGHRPRPDAAGQDDLGEALEVLERGPPRHLQLDPVQTELDLEIPEGFTELLLAGDLPGQPELTADLRGGFKKGHPVAAGGKGDGAGQPGRPGPDHGDPLALFGLAKGRRVSWQARGLTRQEAVFRAKIWSRQAWLQAMQVLISSSRPSLAFFAQNGSARKGLARLTISAQPSASTDSATSGILMRLLVTRGIRTLPSTVW